MYDHSITTGSDNISYALQRNTAPAMLFPTRFTADINEPFQSTETAKAELFETFVLTYDEALKIESVLFEAEKEKYFLDYENQYIALLNGQLVGWDTDYSVLAERVYATYGYDTPVYIPKVTRRRTKHRFVTPKYKKG